MVIRCLMTVVVVCLLGTPVNAMTMEECKAQYKADLGPKGEASTSWPDYQMKRCGINPNDAAPKQKRSAPTKH